MSCDGFVSVKTHFLITFGFILKASRVSWEWMSPRPRFEKYADDGSKMAYFQI